LKRELKLKVIENNKLKFLADWSSATKFKPGCGDAVQTVV
jgi:hypothetical protein